MHAPAQLVPVAVTAAKYSQQRTYGFALEGTTVACPAALDVLTQPRIYLIEEVGTSWAARNSRTGVIVS